MFSRSAAVVARGRTLSPLSPLSPIFLPGLNTAKTNQRKQSLKFSNETKRSFGTVPTVNVLPPFEEVGSPLPTAASFGYEVTIMERLQAALASPFSPSTFVRSMSTSGESAKDTASNRRLAPETAHRGQTVPALRPHLRKRPAPLPLHQPNRLSGTSPLSPFHYGIVAARASITPISPTAFLQVSPLTRLAHITENQIRHQKMEKLARCLGENIPQEIVYPSFGQVGKEADKVDSFLDLYRKRTVDDSEFLGLKSPAPRETKRDWACFDEVESVGDTGKTKKRMLRRSRSLGSLDEFYSAAEVLDLKSPHYLASAHPVDPPTPSSAKQLTAADDISPVLDSSTPNIFEEIELKVARKKSIANAKAIILGVDAIRMADFRKNFKRRRPPPLNLTFGPRRPVRNASMISPFPATPSPLVAVKSPRAPYWAKPLTMAVPKTPRTLRTERRQGWGGSWNFWSIGEIMDRTKGM